MAYFLAFLVIAIFVPMVTLSKSGRITLSFVFALTLISGTLATIHSRIRIYFVAALTIVTLAVDLIAEFDPAQSSPPLESALKLACLSILVSVTIKRTFRPGPINVHRVMGGIAGYLLIGFAWVFAYLLVVLQAPNAIHFESSLERISSRQPTPLVYFSFATLTTVGYGDAYPVHPVARSLAIAEALVGQLYLAILIASLVGMALQARSTSVDPENTDTS